MATIVDYPRVIEQLTSRGLVCNYHNSGAFGFPRGADFHIVGWIGGDDATIRPEMREKAQLIPPPYEDNLARLAVCAWEQLLPDEDAWLMPMSHWAYEMQFGSAGWMPDLLRSAGIDPKDLDWRNNGSALAFPPAEREQCARFIAGLLGNLGDSDFMLAFPGRGVLCMIHHHQQLWWMCGEELARGVRGDGGVMR